MRLAKILSFERQRRRVTDLYCENCGQDVRGHFSFALGLAFVSATRVPAASRANRSALSRSRLLENAFCAISCSVIAFSASTWRNALRASRSAEVIGLGGSISPGVFVIFSPSAQSLQAGERLHA